MHVSSGKAYGHQLFTSPIKNLNPVTTVVRKPLFDAIADKIIGKRVLDLFAGTGSLGIEALSRGATFAYFVDHSQQSCNLIKKNLNHSFLLGKYRLFCQDVFSFLESNYEKFDLVFADPPMNFLDLRAVLEQLKKNLNDGGLIVLRNPVMPDLNTLVTYKLVRETNYLNEKFILLTYSRLKTKCRV